MQGATITPALTAHIIVKKAVKGAGKLLLVPIGAENAPACLRIARQCSAQ
jgi:hypothetical protein